jgi:hypothetical protein
MTAMADDDGIRLTPEQQKSRRSRSIAIALILVALIVMFYLVTIVRLGGNIAERAL